MSDAHNFGQVWAVTCRHLVHDTDVDAKQCETRSGLLHANALVLPYMTQISHAQCCATLGLLHAGALAADDRDRLRVDEALASAPSR